MRPAIGAFCLVSLDPPELFVALRAEPSKLLMGGSTFCSSHLARTRVAVSSTLLADRCTVRRNRVAQILVERGLTPFKYGTAASIAQELGSTVRRDIAWLFRGRSCQVCGCAVVHVPRG